MTCARAGLASAVAATRVAAHTQTLFESLIRGTGAPRPSSSDFRPFCPANRADGDQPLDIGRTMAEIGEHSPCVSANTRGCRRTRLRLPIEGEPGRRKAFGHPAVLFTLLELHRGRRMVPVPVSEFLACLHWCCRDLLLSAPGQRVGAAARAELGGDVVRCLRKDPAVAELIDPRTRRHAGGKLAARARRRFAPRALKQELNQRRRVAERCFRPVATSVTA